MWPKMLLELLPHLSRLVPMADRFFSSRAANEAELATLSAEVRSDLGRVTAANEGVYRKLQEHAAQLDLVVSSAGAAAAAAGEQTRRIAALEDALAAQARSLRLLLILLIFVAALVATLTLWLVLTRVR